MLDQVALRILETTISTHHKVCAMERKLDDMARRRTRGWIAPLLSGRAIPWLVAAVLLAAGQMDLAKAILGLPVPR